MRGSLPPGPNLSPDEQTFQWFSRPYDFLKECAECYGDAFTLEFKSLGKHVLFSHPSAIQQIFAGDVHTFHAGEGNSVIRPFLGKHSLLQLDGDAYMRHRKLMLPAFHPGKMNAYGVIMKETVERLTDSWKIGEPFSLQTPLLEISLEIILRVVFGVSAESPRFVQMKQVLVTLLDAVSFSTQVTPASEEPAQWNPWERFREKSALLDQIFSEEIEERRAGKKTGDDVLTMLLSARDEENAPFSDAELRDELVTLLLAGHETAATAMSWAIYWVHYMSDVHHRLVSEIDSIAEKFDVETILELRYLDAVIKETLRIYPVIPVVSRRLQKPVEITGFLIDSGVHVVPCIYLVHHRKDLYPNPDTFRPERFFERRYSPYEYLPFGGGIRRCLGMAFGQTEMKIMLALILKNFTMQLADEGIARPRPVRRSVVVVPSGGTKIILTARRF